ncbi:hypothetical protein G5B30_15440 [Sphingobacterium sp. SGG-5]|uniref:hypothetical protein n=1 Tax=Sphingobacterium sp. SGG-5 TaxID=2710881 RepID=UPI0013EBA0DA|nr:hypothetical protein [Sphingobacterium sp. SGG-5]NGM63302.1 hypothetical protein [Sphingobacterium sp. SGG-5]
MKKSLLIAAISMFLSFGLNAQTKPKGIFLHHKAVMDELNMTPEQRTKIVEIRKATDVKSIVDDTTLSESEKKKAKIEMYRKRTQEQNAVLTPEQLAKLKKMKAEAKKGN